jgi:predicted transcriptional regulator
MRALKRLLWWLLASSSGGYNRARIIKELTKTPRNANELATILNLDYKTTRHHLRVLEKNSLINTLGTGYGMIYLPSRLIEENMDLFNTIWEEFEKKINKKKLNGDKR